MSQSGVLTVITSGGGSTIETLTGNTGGAVPPDGSFNINILGNNSTGINVIGNPGTNTLTIVSLQSTTTQEGSITLATNAQAIAGTDSANAITASALAAKLGTQTAHSLALFEGTNAALVPLGAAINGQIPIGSTGADPVLGVITSTGGTITVTNGAGSINLDVAAGTHVLETLTGNTGGALNPTAGNINTLGTGSITIAGSGSTLTTQLTGLTNHAVQVGAGTASLTQLAVGSNGQVLIGATTADPAFATLTSSDSSISFTTGANTLSLQVAGGSTTIKTITGNSGGAESPSAGNFNIVGTGSITVAGTANTETVQLTGLTNHNVLIGAGTATITKVAPSATSGIPLVSNGASSDPSFTTAVVAGGGTGVVTMTTAYAPVCAGTTATGALQVASTGLSTSGYILTSNGSSALPSFQAPAAATFSVVIQVFTSTGTYTPTTGMLYCQIECVGGGGAGGGTDITSSVQNAVGGGGGGGEYTTAIFSAATIGASKAVTIGAGGTAVSAGTGNTGGTTSVGATLISAIGGTGGGTSGTIVATGTATGGIGGTGGTGATYAVPGQQGTYGWGQLGVIDVGGGGGNSLKGYGGTSTASAAGGTNSGNPGQVYGGGGSGARSGISQSANVGAVGAAGIVIITEYI
jgi:hypothetical protein